MHTDSSTSWPPPDPDRMHRKPLDCVPKPILEASSDDYAQAFRERQRLDFARLRPTSGLSAKQLRGREDSQISVSLSSSTREGAQNISDAEVNGLAWRDSEGERLEDFGVDEEIELYDEDDVPLAELIRRRSAHERTKRSR